MKQFVFTLQALYDVQESTEKQIKMQMSAIEAELAQRLREMETLNSSFDIAKSEYCAAVAGGMQAIRIRNYGHFFERLRAVMMLQQGKINQLEIEKEKCLQKLIHVRREKMLLDKLRQEQYEEYMSEIKKQQAKMMDHFVSYKIRLSHKEVYDGEKACVCKKPAVQSGRGNKSRRLRKTPRKRPKEKCRAARCC
jgi:flagellar FliJ protein